jgi:nitric oxide reductase subunit B
MRVPGDILFSLGAALLGWFVLGLLTGHSFSKEAPRLDSASRRAAAEQSEQALIGH